MTKEQPGANSLSDLMLEYFRRLDYINDEAEKAAKVVGQDKRELGTEFAGRTGKKKKFLTKEYAKHRRELKEARARETMAPADLQELEAIEAAIEGFSGLELIDHKLEQVRAAKKQATQAAQ